MSSCSVQFHALNTMECLEAYGRIKGWNVIADFSVGVFEWLGFSKETLEKIDMLDEYYCAGGRIHGAVKMAGVWKTAEKPFDRRRKEGKKNNEDSLN